MTFSFTVTVLLLFTVLKSCDFELNYDVHSVQSCKEGPCKKDANDMR